jgi:hypothetical protein
VTTIAVAGALAAKPGNGGEAWVRLSYLLGLRQLGFDVAFVEQFDRLDSAGVDWFRSVLQRFSVRGSLVDAEGNLLAGEPLRETDALLNVSGNLRLPRLLALSRRRAYIDLDPCFTQVWHAAGAVSVGDHHVHFTVGENIGTRGCDVPTNGIRWQPTRPPVVLDEWPAAVAPSFDRFTTVSTWRPGHGGVALGSRTLGLRVHSFRRLLDLPRAAELPFEAALSIDRAEEADIGRLQAGGWRLVSPRRVASTPQRFRSYVQGSGAEFSVAQEAYAESGCGWLSDRTARYLASGRPALVEDTGQRSVPTGRGLLVFRTAAQARRQAQALVRDYDEHCAAARELASEHFDARIVLRRLLEDVL